MWLASNAERCALADWLVDWGYEVDDASGIAEAANVAAFDRYIT